MYWLLKALLLLIVPVAMSDCNNLKAKITNLLTHSMEQSPS